MVNARWGSRAAPRQGSNPIDATELLFRIDGASPYVVAAFTSFCVDAKQFESLGIFVDDPDGIRAPGAVMKIVDDDLDDRVNLVARVQGLIDQNRWGSVFIIVEA